MAFPLRVEWLRHGGVPLAKGTETMLAMFPDWIVPRHGGVPLAKGTET